MLRSGAGMKNILGQTVRGEPTRARSASTSASYGYELIVYIRRKESWPDKKSGNVKVDDGWMEARGETDYVTTTILGAVGDPRKPQGSRGGSMVALSRRWFNRVTVPAMRQERGPRLRIKMEKVTWEWRARAGWCKEKLNDARVKGKKQEAPLVDRLDRVRRGVAVFLHSRRTDEATGSRDKPVWQPNRRGERCASEVASSAANGDGPVKSRRSRDSVADADTRHTAHDLEPRTSSGVADVGAGVRGGGGAVVVNAAAASGMAVLQMVRASQAPDSIETGLGPVRRRFGQAWGVTAQVAVELKSTWTARLMPDTRPS